MSSQASAGRVRSTYEFIKAHRGQYSVQMTTFADELEREKARQRTYDAMVRTQG